MAPLRCAVVGLTGIGTRHALGLVGDERVTLVAGCDDGYVCPHPIPPGHARPV